LKKEQNNELQTKKKKKKICSIVICIVFISVFFAWQNNSLQLSYYTYASNDISSDLDGYCIVQISDLHNKCFGIRNHRLIEEIKRLEPDMIVITGDLVDSNHTNIDTAIVFLEQAVTIAPCYYITGNHELWLEEEDRTDLMNRIEKTGTFILDNEIISISEKDTSFTLVGLDDASLLGTTLHEMTKDISQEEFVLLLAHEPQYFLNYNKENVDLILSGHAHGGQVRLPYVGGLVAPGQGFLPEYTDGLHVENDVSMIISRGLGNSIIPVRLFNRPEIVCIELQSK